MRNARKKYIRPDDETKPFMARWKTLVRILLVESSVKHAAHVAVEYGDFEDGDSCYPSNERIVRETGYDEKTVRFAWSVMRGLGMAERVGHAVASLRLADEYQLRIPDNWINLPILGPHGQKFTCLNCSKLINPQGNCSVNKASSDRPGGVRFDVAKMCFCPSPRRRGGRSEPDCREMWNREQESIGRLPWHKLGPDVWKLFSESRGDDW